MAGWDFVRICLSRAGLLEETNRRRDHRPRHHQFLVRLLGSDEAGMALLVRTFLSSSSLVLEISRSFSARHKKVGGRGTRTILLVCRWSLSCTKKDPSRSPVLMCSQN